MRILIIIIFCQMFLTSFSQEKKNAITIFGNSGFVIGGQGYHPGIGGGLQFGYEKVNGTIIIETSFIYFATKDDVFNNRFDKSWIVVRPGYNFPFGNNFYGQLNGGGILETGTSGIEGYGAVLGAGLGYKPKVGKGHLDIFTKFNLLIGALSASHYIAVGIGYAIPFSASK